MHYALCILHFLGFSFDLNFTLRLPLAKLINLRHAVSSDILHYALCILHFLGFSFGLDLTLRLPLAKLIIQNALAFSFIMHYALCILHFSALWIWIVNFAGGWRNQSISVLFVKLIFLLLEKCMVYFVCTKFLRQGGIVCEQMEKICDNA